MTLPNPAKPEITREVGVAEQIETLVTDLNGQIARAHDLGLRVEIEILPLQRAVDRWPRPSLSAMVTKRVLP